MLPEVSVSLVASFPSLEQFWLYHLCPSYTPGMLTGCGGHRSMHFKSQAQSSPRLRSQHPHTFRIFPLGEDSSRNEAAKRAAKESFLTLQYAFGGLRGPYSCRRLKGSPAHAEGVEHRRSPRSLGRNKARPAGGGWAPSGGWATGNGACGP